MKHFYYISRVKDEAYNIRLSRRIFLLMRKRREASSRVNIEVGVGSERKEKETGSSWSIAKVAEPRIDERLSLARSAKTSRVRC